MKNLTIDYMKGKKDGTQKTQTVRKERNERQSIRQLKTLDGDDTHTRKAEENEREAKHAAAENARRCTLMGCRNSLYVVYNSTAG